MRTCLLLALFLTTSAGIAHAQQAPENSGKDRLCMGDGPAAAGVVADRTTGSTPATISQVAWLSGTWIGTLGTTTVEERWTPPAAGSIDRKSTRLNSSHL